MAYSFVIPTAAITLLLFVFAPAPSVASIILDADGDFVRNGGSYYIVPHMIGTGGLTVDSSAPCPLYISQKRYSNGSPVTMSNPVKLRHLSTSSAITFYFNGETATCNKLLGWWVAPKDAKDIAHVVAGSDGPFKPTSGLFRIEEAKSGKFVYNIKFCRTVESEILRVSAMECDDVTFVDGLLAVVPNAPYPVVFKKFHPQLSSYYV